MSEQLNKCLLCGSDDFQPMLQATDYLVSNEVFNLVTCTDCSFTFTNPRPDQNEIVKYYKSSSYISHTDKSNSFINFIYRLVRELTLKQKSRLISRYTPQITTLLDYGCGTGHFLEFMNRKGWQVIGCEPDSSARSQAQVKLGDQKIVDSIHQLGSKKFRVITLFHVLEHVHELATTFERLVELLEENGVLILALPNHNSWDAIKYGSEWAGYDVPRHLYHFDYNACKRLAENFGLKIVAQHPMKFDSYYVSMLSEKNRGKSFSLLSGFISGYISNIKARKTKQYSSLIYVLQLKR